MLSVNTALILALNNTRRIMRWKARGSTIEKPDGKGEMSKRKEAALIRSGHIEMPEYAKKAARENRGKE